MRPEARALLSSVLLMLLGSAVLAQTPAPTIVRWESGARNSHWLVRNGLEIVMVDQDGLTVKVALTVRPPTQVALVSVTNQTGQRIELLPSLMTLDLVGPEPKPFPYEDPDTLAAKVRLVSPWMYVFAAMAGMGTQRSYTTGTVGDMTFHSTTTTHDQAAEDRTLNGIKEEQERKAFMASSIQREGLRENTLLPGEGVGGAVFFTTPKHYDKDYGTGKLGTVLRVPVGDYLFEFPFWWEGNPPAPNCSWHSTRCPGVIDFPLWWKAKKVSGAWR